MRTATQPQTETPVADSTMGDSAGQSLSSLFDESPVQPTHSQPIATGHESQADGVSAPPEDSAATAETPEAAADASKSLSPKADASPPSEEGETVTLTKKEVANREYKLREKVRKEREEKAALQKRLAEYEGTTQESEPDPVQEAVLKERIRTSAAAFKRQYGEEAFTDLCVAEDAPWIKIEEDAKSGDQEANALWQRALGADDPYEEIRVIVGERQLYEQYGTRRLPDLIAKVRAEAKAEADRAVQEHLNPKKQTRTGPVPAGLGSTPSSGRDSPAGLTDQPPRSLSAMFE